MESYNEFINNIINTRGRFNCDGYCERHHILPKCCGGTNASDNLVDLYAREHFIAHKLLALENPNNKDLIYAWHCMAVVKRDNMDRYELTPDEYEELRVKFSDSMSGIGNPMYGKNFSEESKQKMRDSHPDISGENNPMFGKHFSDDTKQKMSEKRKEYFKTHSHPCNGIQKTKEQCEKQSRTLTGKYIGENSFNKKSIYCIELAMTFTTVKYGAEYVGIKPCCISDHLHGRQKSAGKHPSTNEPLHWLYLEDAIKLGYLNQTN